ncbi:MAG: T9SS type A sorting domain-containing protein, partial [Saprospiraceae bacterium]|nr:T9SS type A sorting domain-containing protein [Saprospiraceae bacterium]
GVTNTLQMGFVRISENTGLFVNILSGSVRKDNDENCIADAGEPNIQHARITATNGLENFSTFSDGQGAYSLSLPSGEFTVVAEPDEHFFFQCPNAANAVTFAPNANGNAAIDLPIQSLDLIHEIKGKVGFDQDGDCLPAPDDPAAVLWNIFLDYGAGYMHLKTNNAGEYSVFVPSGDYSLQLSPWNHNYGICGNAERTFSLNGVDPLVHTEDFSAFPKIICPEMHVNIGGNSIRPCSTRTVSIYYRNQGTVVAENAAVTVTLDPALTYVDATPNPESVDGNTLQFALGDLSPAPNAGGYEEIKINVFADCDLQIGQHVCISALASPNTPCEHPSGWQGAIVAVEGECSSTSDSIFFKIRNIGNGPNLAPLNYIIAEDQIVLRQGIFQLPAGGEQIEGVLPMFDSTTVSIVAQQEPGAPGDTLVSFSLTNCIGMNGGTPGGMGWGSGPYSDNICLAIVNSFDPNDKTAYPIGYGEQNLVRPGTPLEYTIRFQNTGNDTAFLVILRDTLSDNLDRGSIQLLGASHPYELAQISDSILHIRFDNILLPDSTTNPEGSQGHITFRISPLPELPNGTQVHNRAAIYFDQNPPILTNTVTRTYGEYFVVSTDAPQSPEVLAVKIFPNPFISETVFQLPEHNEGAAYRLEVFDIAGRLWHRQSFQDSRCVLRRESLEAGLYFWSILQGEQTVATGKIIAEN